MSTETALKVSRREFPGLLPISQWGARNVGLFQRPRPIKKTDNVHIIQYELNWDFRMGQEACIEKIRDLNVDFKKITNGNCFAFVNAKKTLVRLLTINDKGRPVSIVQKITDGERIDVRALKYLPTAFNGPKLEIDEATSKFLDVFFSTKKTQKKILNLESF